MSIGLSELIVIAVVVAIVIRPDDWPKLVKKFGYWYGRFQKWNEELNSSIRAMGEIDQDSEDEVRNRVERKPRR